VPLTAAEEHVPAESVQLPTWVPLVLPRVKVTVPVGATAGVVVSLTVAVNTVVCVVVMLDGLALTDVLVASAVTVRVAVPALGAA
jgi:hypothetical protein